MFDFRKYVLERGNAVLMTHLVSGYPDHSTSRKLALKLIHSGADVLEVQIPFSDPMADGTTIMNACETALLENSTPNDCFDLVRHVTATTATPVVIMTYFNIVMNRGIREFVQDSAKSGAAGLIVPDLLLDSAEGTILIQECREEDLNLIPVVSPGMNKERQALVLSLGSGFVYATLKVGITGSSAELNSCSFAASIAAVCDMPVLSGFGISSLDEVSSVLRNSDGIVIGSHLIGLFDKGGVSSVCEFASSVSELIRTKRKAVEIESQ